jgi:hypothetical protein
MFGVSSFMRLVTCSALIVHVTAALHAQSRERILNTDSGRVVLRLFTTGGISTREWTDLDDHWGLSTAYAPNGTVLVEHQTRRFAGHASVHFTYHPNGAISRAEYSEAPDGGIQWYRCTTTFDDQGNRSGFSEQGHDDDGHIPRPEMRMPPAVDPPETVSVEEQRLFTNEVFLVNPTKWTCRVRVLVKDPSPALKDAEYTIDPGDTLRIGAYTAGETFVQPEAYLTIATYRKLRKGPYYKMARYRMAEVQAVPEHRRYYRMVRGWYSTKKIW